MKNTIPMENLVKQDFSITNFGSNPFEELRQRMIDRTTKPVRKEIPKPPQQLYKEYKEKFDEIIYGNKP
jgi:hypothetical protein